MAIYLRERKTSSGKVVQELVKLPKNERFWNKEGIAENKIRNGFYYQKDKKGHVCKVVSKDIYGSTVTHKLMRKPKKFNY